ncbi:hypothetical protein [Nesterenkonia halotolerans]|uniref:Uncharacterized protein n=1 Tax=Nesterenkonia halotolerans TaxID=225325 RepID=A0ABR9J619_9MICC|nr:hypothetical protein [Nesterenkonia halotolerans]MBE1514289.1 hypothetical protein [Nesterenkonia halotolerans]
MLLADPNQFSPSIRTYEVNDWGTEVALSDAIDTLIAPIGERNFDLYEGLDGEVTKA